MKSSGRIAVAVAVFLLVSSTARAAGVDFKDPRRALGREDDIRVTLQSIEVMAGKSLADFRGSQQAAGLFYLSFNERGS